MANEADRYWRNDCSGQFTATISVRGTINQPIRAESLEAAREEAQAVIDSGVDAGLLDLAETVLTDVRPAPTMYLVVRDGQRMQVSDLRPTDEPREPAGQYEVQNYMVRPTA